LERVIDFINFKKARRKTRKLVRKAKDHWLLQKAEAAQLKLEVWKNGMEVYQGHPKWKN